MWCRTYVLTCVVPVFREQWFNLFKLFFFHKSLYTGKIAVYNSFFLSMGQTFLQEVILTT